MQLMSQEKSLENSNFLQNGILKQIDIFFQNLIFQNKIF